MMSKVVVGMGQGENLLHSGRSESWCSCYEISVKYGEKQGSREEWRGGNCCQDVLYMRKIYFQLKNI